jgi:site-specific recombinase XerD
VALGILFRFSVQRKMLERDLTEFLGVPKIERYLPETLSEPEIARYLEAGLPELVVRKTGGVVFLSVRGRRLINQRIWHLLRDLARRGLKRTCIPTC